MVLTITVVGNGQGQSGGGGGHAVLSPNELAQLMSGQTVTGLLNPDGSITLNSNVLSAPQMTSMPTTIQNGPPTLTSSASTNYQPQVASPSSNSITSITAISSNSNISSANNNHSQTTTTQKKTTQKRLSAKQKLAQQQQQQLQQQQQQQQQKMQLQSPDIRPILAAQPDQTINQQPQIVATVQLPNGQIGQLIAPSGGQFWSPNAMNLQQLSMAVAAATGTMPQTMSIPGSSNQQGQLMSTSSVQQPQQQHQQQQPQHQQQPMQMANQMQQSNQQHQQQPLMQVANQVQQNNQQQQHPQTQSITNQNQNQVVTAVSMSNNQVGQVINRQNQNQIWSGGPISLSQLSALAQQGVVQLSPVQGIPATGPNGQRVMEMIPQAAIQGLLSQSGQPIQAIPLSSGGQFITQDPNDPNKWQIIQSNQVTGQQSNVQTPSLNNDGNNEIPNQSMRSGGTFNQFANSASQNNVSSDSGQSTQPQRKLKRLACTCPNCRDGDNSRNNGDKKKQHICHFPDCNKVYGKTSHLRAHLRWHSGKFPLSSLIVKRFPLLSRLNIITTFIS